MAKNLTSMMVHEISNILWLMKTTS
jgi:hypothetical protein